MLILFLLSSQGQKAVSGQLQKEKIAFTADDVCCTGFCGFMFCFH
jgi:hypothetical protein